MLRLQAASFVLAISSLIAVGHAQSVSGAGYQLSPLPDSAADLPPLVTKLSEPSLEELAYRARVRDYTFQIRRIAHKHFGPIRARKVRDAGIDLLADFTDPAAFLPMIEVLSEEDDDVRLAMLDHFAEQGDAGQAALAYVAIMSDDGSLRHEATRRMTTPPPPLVIDMLDRALRSDDDNTANAAGALAGALGVQESIPLLIFAQARTPPAGGQGDLAWIAIGTQTLFVRDLVPVVGDSSGAFQPVMGALNEGVILRIVDAVAIIYRTEVHRTLVSMTGEKWSDATSDFGYDSSAWREWYNNEYLPHLKREEKLARLSREESGARDSTSPPQEPKNPLSD